MGEGIEQSENDITLYVEWDERQNKFHNFGYKRYRKADKHKTHGREVKIGEEMRCLRCSKKFVKKAIKQRFCSDKCRTRYHNKRTVYY